MELAARGCCCVLLMEVRAARCSWGEIRWLCSKGEGAAWGWGEKRRKRNEGVWVLA